MTLRLSRVHAACIRFGMLDAYEIAWFGNAGLILVTRRDVTGHNVERESREVEILATGVLRQPLVDSVERAGAPASGPRQRCGRSRR